MHADEVDTSVELVQQLLGEQFPQWASLPIERLASSGTDNAMFRLGTELVARMPRIHWATASIEREARWLPVLAPLLPCPIPTPVALAQPSPEFPWRWSIYRWIDGVNPSAGHDVDLMKAARDVAAFIKALHTIDVTDAPPALEVQLRGAPIHITDRATRRAIDSLAVTHDVDLLTAVWDAALAAPSWEHPPLWIHGDLLPGNLLFEAGKLHAVIDFGCACVGDPACDLMIAWALLRGDSRRAFREAIQMDDATWSRARGHAISQTAMFIPYYRDTNPVGVARAEHLLREVLADFDS